jgi:hypothetical protein
MRRLFLFATLVSLAAAVLAPALGRVASAQDFADLVTIYGKDNAAIGLVSVSGLYDPFEVVEPGNDPGPGNRFALMEAGFFNTGSEPFDFDPDGLLLVDDRGMTYSRVTILNLTVDSTNYFQQAGTLNPGSEFYGDNAYAIPDGTVIERIIYSTGIQRVTTVDTRASTVASGTPVPLNDVTGTEIAQITVNEVLDAFEGVDPASPAGEGARYVAVDISVANTGGQPLPLTVSDFEAIDDLGRLATPAAVVLSDPAFALLADGSVEPGATVQGVVVYQLPEVNLIRQVTFTEGGTRSLVIADLEATGSLTDATGGCRDFANWASDIFSRTGEIGTFAQNLSTVTTPETLDAGMVRMFADMAASILENHREVVPPPAVESVNAFFTEEFMAAAADSLDRLATALETGDFAAAQQALGELRAIAALFNPGNPGDLAVQEMQTACPEEWEEFTTLGG